MNMMAMRDSWILVSLATSLRGGIRYEKEDIQVEKRADGSEDKEWKTLRHIEDRKEWDEGIIARSKVRTLIKSTCVWTPFGLIALAENEDKLDQAIAEAQTVKAEYNDLAKHSRLRVNLIKGRIASDDTEALKSVMSEFSSLLQDLEEATAEGEVKTIRDLANRANQMADLLPEESEARASLQEAVKTSRKVARDVVRLVEKRGEDLQAVLQQSNMKAVSEARFLFEREEEALEQEIEERASDQVAEEEAHHPEEEGEFAAAPVAVPDDLWGSFI